MKARLVAMVGIGAVVFAMLVLTAPGAMAATPRCLGAVATIVGTDRSEFIKGTASRDVIVVDRRLLSV